MNSPNISLPPRITRPPFWIQLLIFLCLALFISAFEGLKITHYSVDDLLQIPKQFVYVIDKMFPPSLSRLPQVLNSILVTLEMALLGTIIGVPFSLFLAIFSSRNLTSNHILYFIARGIITFFRTTPSLVWAIFLIAAVGLGPRSGTVTLIIVTIGFCGRFFAEAIEEVSSEYIESLQALGATKSGVIFSVIIPQALPSFINTILFNLEHNTRSSTVLGIVGAGGIGIELMVSIKTFRYDEAITILILLFLTVMCVESACSSIRHKFIQ